MWWQPPTSMQKLIMASVRGVEPAREPQLFLEQSPIPKPTDHALLALIERVKKKKRRR